jgi:hypothetical protein
MVLNVGCLKVIFCCTELTAELSMVNHIEVVHVLKFGLS